MVQKLTYSIIALISSTSVNVITLINLTLIGWSEMKKKVDDYNSGDLISYRTEYPTVQISETCN